MPVKALVVSRLWGKFLPDAWCRRNGPAREEAVAEPKYPAGPCHGAVLSAAEVQVPDLFSLMPGDRTPGNRVELPLAGQMGVWEEVLL